MATHRKVWTVAMLLLALLGIAARVYSLVHMESAEMCGTDFPVFYGGGQLLGTPLLYSGQAMQELERSRMGCSSDFAIFIRLPFFAALMKPWALLPFWTAFWLYRAASAAALGIFIWLWPAPRAWSLLACAWSLPLGYTLANGQDVAFLLLWLAVAVALRKAGWEFAAGCALAMCATKFHLFVLLPLLLFRHRRMLAGWAAGGAAITVLCFAVGGWRWPVEFLAAISSNIDPTPDALPNIRGLVHSSVPLEIALATLVLAAAVYVIRRGDFWYGLSTVLTGGILLSHHFVRSDAALLIPVALMLAWHPLTRYSKVAAIYLASPLPHILPGPVQAIAMLSLLFLLAYELWDASPEALTDIH